MTPITPSPPRNVDLTPSVTVSPHVAETSRQSGWMGSLPFYYGWINVVMAAIAMTATLPSRTHGLGLITVPLLADLQMTETLFTSINFVSCLLGALFSLPVGYLIDRYGVRVVLTAVSVCFGVVVLGMATVTGPLSLLIALTLIRGFGQSALSIVSTAIVGKWFNQRMGLAMGVYAVLLSFGFIGTIVGVGAAAEVYGWRVAWNGCGVFLLFGLAPLGWLLVRSTPESCGLRGDEQVRLEESAGSTNVVSATIDYTYQQALLTPAFWVFACGTSMFNFVWSAITLLNQSVLMERGFSEDVTKLSLALLVPGGLLANIVCGVMTRRTNLGRMLGTGLFLLCISLALFPHITTKTQLWAYSSTMGVIGGIVTVAHFAAWRSFFGASHLGRISGPAQLLSVLFSATGPLFAAYCRQATGSYQVGFYLMSAIVGVLGLMALFVPIPPELKRPTSN
jgi:MFS family permease